MIDANGKTSAMRKNEKKEEEDELLLLARSLRTTYHTNDSNQWSFDVQMFKFNMNNSNIDINPNGTVIPISRNVLFHLQPNAHKFITFFSLAHKSNSNT